MVVVLGRQQEGRVISGGRQAVYGMAWWAAGDVWHGWEARAARKRRTWVDDVRALDVSRFSAFVMDCRSLDFPS